MPRPAPVFVHFLPSLIPPGALKGGVAVVVDVLRATTAMVHALNSGCEAIIPCLEVEDAKAAASRLPSGSYILAGERQGIPIPGFDFGNSPGSFTPDVCRGKTLVMTTTNGTRAILASLEADRVLIGAFSNLKATVAQLMLDPRPVHVVCSGTDNQISLEDAYLAGVISEMLIYPAPVRGGSPRRFGNDSARIVGSNWSMGGHNFMLGDSTSSLIREGRGGQRVAELGQAADIEVAAKVDRFDFAAELRREPFGIIRL